MYIYICMYIYIYVIGPNSFGALRYRRIPDIYIHTHMSVCVHALGCRALNSFLSHCENSMSFLGFLNLVLVKEVDSFPFENGPLVRRAPCHYDFTRLVAFVLVLVFVLVVCLVLVCAMVLVTCSYFSHCCSFSCSSSSSVISSSSSSLLLLVLRLLRLR